MRPCRGPALAFASRLPFVGSSIRTAEAEIGQKLTTKQWIARARDVWGTVYDYTFVEYVDNKTPVEVRCGTHGSWFPLPANHTKSSEPRGCPKCGRSKQIIAAKKPFDVFVAEASAAHKGQYTYDLATYKGANQPTRIHCPRHGEFWQRPSAHVRLHHGCPSCAKAKASSRSKAQFGPEVDARIRKNSDGVVTLKINSYAGINRQAEFVCSTHGAFRRLVNSALLGHPCLACSDPVNQSRITRFASAQGKLSTEVASRWPQYHLEPIVYKGKRTRIYLSCSEHGSFALVAEGLKRSSGCPSCVRALSQESRTAGVRKKNAETLTLRAQKWLRKAKTTHGDTYDYSRVIYLSVRKGVEIGCSRHGFFTQPPSTHLESGCRKCADEDLKGLYSDRYFDLHPQEASRPATIYYLQFTAGEEHFYKVGITRTSLAKRFGMVASSNIKIEVLSVCRTTLLNALEAEKTILREHAQHCSYRPKLIGFPSARALRLGQSECFSEPLSWAEHLALVGRPMIQPRTAQSEGGLCST